MRTTVGIDTLKSKLNLCIGKTVWSAIGGGAGGTTLLFDLGDKVRLDRPVENPALSEEERNYEGELRLMIICAWRVEMEGIGIVSGSSDTDDEIMLSGPNKLIGETVAEISVNSFLDLRVVFSGGARLSLFCNQHGKDPDIDFCYALSIGKEEVCSVGNGVITFVMGASQ
jgi:hypothetical protein